MNQQITGEVQLIDACLKSVDRWGWTDIYNICDGTMQSLPWGISDYFVLCFCVLFFLAFLMLFIVFGLYAIKAIFGL